MLPWLVAGATAGGLVAIPLAAPAAVPLPGPGGHAAASDGRAPLRANRPGEPHHGPRLAFTVR